MKKLLLFIAMFAILSCSTVHKNISSVKKTEDSTSVVKKDTTSLSTKINTTDDFSAKGIDVTVDFDNLPDTAKGSTSKQINPIDVSSSEEDAQQQIKDAVSNYLLPGRIPVKSITIHIDSLSNNSTTAVAKDSNAVKQTTISNVKTQTDTKTKVVSRTGFSVGFYIVGAIVILLIVILAAIKYKLF